jgi:hypothetical protein
MRLEDIPQELLMFIFEYLPKSNSFNIIINHSNFSLVSKQFYSAISHDFFWSTPIQLLDQCCSLPNLKSLFLKKSKKLGKAKQLSKCELNFMFFGNCYALTTGFICHLTGQKMVVSPSYQISVKFTLWFIFSLDYSSFD